MGMSEGNRAILRENAKTINDPLLLIEQKHLYTAAQICIRCGDNATGFRDSVSVREFHISALCQSCQDDIFAPSTNDPDSPESF